MREKSGKRNLLLAATIVGLGLSASMNPACAGDLWDAINTAATAGLYTLHSDYTLPAGKSSLGDLKVGVFVLEGNNKTIDLNKKRGVSIDDDKSMTIRNAIIKNANSTAEGGAIYNEGKLEITGSKFNDNLADDDDAGAIWNEGTITKILADFNNNKATDNGAAIYNKGTITTISGNFNNNVAEDDGAAIYNKGTITTISGNFDSNNHDNSLAGSSGGAIYNSGTIDTITGNFTNNGKKCRTGYGAAIYNKDKIGTISGKFEDNFAEYVGGAIYNKGTITTINATFNKNASYNTAGAIYNKGTITTITADFVKNSSESDSGGAIYNEGKIGTISGEFLDNYTVERGWYKVPNILGAAIYNNGTIDSITGTFKNNSLGPTKYYGGGAIYNKDTIGSISADFISNSARGKGAAIYNYGKIPSISGTFERNKSRYGWGGAIWNSHKIDSLTADFKYNESHNSGGAIYNGCARQEFGSPEIKSIIGNFTGNTAGASGGAIYNSGSGGNGAELTAITGNFTNNSSGSGFEGGAIFSEGYLRKVTGDFTGNSAGGKGGAIYFDGGYDGGVNGCKLTLTGSFINNYAGDKGGAIYNEDNDVIIQTDDTHDITFSGNKQNVTRILRDGNMNILSVEGGESNAIFNNDYVEFNVKDGRTIWMYDRLAGNDGAGWDWKKTGAGALALGEDMSGVKGDVLIEQGIVKLVKNDKDASIYGTGFSSADVTYNNNTYVDSQNNHIEDVCLGYDIDLDGTLHALIDVNLANQTGDKLTIADDSVSGSGNIVIDSIIIITGGGSYESPRNVTIADEHTKEKISLGSGVTVSGEGYTNWALSYATSSGILSFNGNVTLKEVANATDPASRVFSAAHDEIMEDNIDNIGNANANVIVKMNNHTLDGQNHSGFVTTTSTQKLTINDANVGNFNSTGNGSFIYDNEGAEININNSTFMNNEAANGGIIYSSGKLTLTDSSFINNKISGYGGAMYSKGDVTVNAINKSVEFTSNYDDSNLITNAIYMAGTEENPVTLVLNSKISENEVSIDDKLDGSYYDIVINGAEDSLGDVVFYNEVNTGSLTVSKGLLENNGVLTVTSGKNNGTITCDNSLSDVKGDFILNDGGSETPLVFDNNGSFTQNTLTIVNGKFTTNTDNLHITNDINEIVNDGTLAFNNTTNGSIGQNIKGSTPSSYGTVEIAAADGVKISLNNKSITDNYVKLTSGIFDVTSNAEDGDIDISSMGFISPGNGILNLQDNKAGTIKLGDIKTGTGTDAKDLNVAIDMHFVTGADDIDYAADVISVNSLTGDGKIHVSDIKMSKDNETVPVTPPSTTMTVQVATGDDAIKNMDFTGTTITNIDKTFSSILLEYDNVVTSPTGGKLTVSSSPATLANAVTSFVNVKLYGMNGDETIDELVLHGDQLAVTTNGADILSTSGEDGIFIADSLETLSFNGTLDASGDPETKISGFKTAIDNSSGGTVYLENIEMSGNTTDVLNTGTFNLAGTNKVETIADDTTDPMGSTNIVGGTSTIDSINQKAVNILPDSELNIRADKLSAKDGVDNWGRLNLGSGNLASNIFETQQGTKQSVTNIVGDVTNTSGKTIAQKSVTIANSAKLTTDADKVVADDGITNSGSLNFTGGALASDVTGTGTTNIKGNVENVSRATITQKEINIDNTASLTSFAGNLIATDGISNAGTLNLSEGELGSAVTGAGTTNIIGVVGTNGNNITQTTVNIGQYGTEEEEGYLSNDAVINATNINVTTEGNLDNIGTISATTIANAGNVDIEDGNVNVPHIVTAANATTIINGGSVNADDITNNGEANITGGTVVANIIENTGGGATTIAGGDVTANTSITNSGTGDTDIYSVVKTPLVSATNGDINIYATNGQTATSNLLKDVAGTGLANITTSSGGTVSVNTNSSTLVVDNNVSGAGTLNLNGSAGSEFYVGPNATVSSALNIAAGQLNALDGSNITGLISVAANATLNTMNGGYSTFNNTAFADGSNLKVDVNAISNKSDNFTTPTEPTGGYEYLTDLNIQDMDKLSPYGKSINLSQTVGLNNLQPTDDLTANLKAKYSSVLTPIRKMSANVQMTPEGLMLNFAGTGNKYKDFNPAVMASPVAAQMGGYLTQLQSYDEAFHNMDMYMLMTAQQRQALKNKNKVASLDGGVLYDKTLMRQERAEGWFRPYATFEKVGLRNGPKVENTAYGSYIGGESKMYDLGHGWDGMWGAYVGYNGSHQNYDGVSIYQNGGTLGVLGMAYKGNFFTGLTLNSGASAGEASTMYGQENFAMLMAGIASKTGYNWELANGKFIIQPSWLMSYSFVNTFDYTNAAGVRMHSSPLHAIQLQPEIKFIGNLKNGWQPYASVAMVWNIMDDTKFKANDVTLPELSVKPYVKYGVGIRKIWGERFTGFFQTYLTNGGRNGVGLQAGFTWTFGGGKDRKADEKKIQKSLKKASVLKKIEISGL